MTTQEFDAVKWRAGMFATYKDGKQYPIEQVDFDERLIWLAGLVAGADGPSVVRCENVVLISLEKAL